jgi:putative ABC transport system permease protein
MRSLDLKLFRDLRAMKGQMAAVALVMACGLMVMVMERSLVVSLEGSRDRYYAENRLGDVFCELRRAPNHLRSQLARIPDVASVETRVRGGAILDIPGMKDSAEASMLSIPTEHPQKLNLLHLRAGRLPVPGRRGEVVISEAFADAHGFASGDTIEATIYGARQQLRVAGIALSPEYVYELPPGGIMPDSSRYGIFWMQENELAQALALDGAFNSVSLDVAPGGDIRAVKAELDQILAPYGGLTAYDRTEHPSARMVDDEINGLRAVSIAFPLVFLSVAAFMTSAALTRLVRLQREQIAQLRAFGYSSGAIGWHYFKFALVVVLAAAAIGGALGIMSGRGMITLYRPFFHFPSLVFKPDWSAWAIGFVASAAFSFLGVIGAVRQAMGLPPAEAMRPEPPAVYGPSVLERLGLSRLASTSFRMALRNVERKPWQSFFTVLGLSLATAIPIMSVAMSQGMDYMMDFQWRITQRQDATISLIEPGSSGAMSELRKLPGVIDVEPFRGVPALLHAGHRSRRVAVTGMPEGTRLHRLLDVHENQVPLPKSGILLSAQLAKNLGVQPGDVLRVEVQEGRRPVLVETVAGTITDFAGVGAYMEIDQLRRSLGEGQTISGAHFAIDESLWDQFLAQAKKAPRIGSITTTRAARESYDKLVGDMMGISQAVISFFAIVVAFGVIYNGARIALSERTRDLATLRVLGFTRGEVAAVLVGELALLTLVALMPGLWLGGELTRLLLDAVSTETMRIPAILTGRAYSTAVLIVIISSALSFSVVARKVTALDLLGVLKARE